MRRPKFSLLNLLIATTATGCLLGLAIAYGNDILWALSRVRAPIHVAFEDFDTGSESSEREYVRCEFLNITFDLPAEMQKNATIQRGVMPSLEFRDGTRRIVILLSSYSANRTFFGSPPGPLDSCTTPQLLETIYSADSRDFSFRLPSKKLEIHKWSMKYRDVLAYEGMSKLSFEERDGIHVATLSTSSDPTESPQKMKKLIAWAMPDNSDGGLIYIYDTEDAAGDWGNRIAASVKSLPADNPPRNAAISTLTEAEILEGLVFIDRTDEQRDKHEVAEP